MPREVMIEWTGDESLTGQKVGSRSLRFGVDADEFCAKGMARIVDEHPAPRNFLLHDGVFDPGVLAGSQVKMNASEKEAEQSFFKSQIEQLDLKHAKEAEQKKLAAMIAQKRKEVSRG